MSLIARGSIRLALVLEVLEGKSENFLLVRQIPANDGLGVFFQDSWQIFVDLYGETKRKGENELLDH